MENSIILHTDKRVKAADIDGILDKNTRQMYRDFQNWKNTYNSAKEKHDNAKSKSLLDQGALSVRLDINESRRAMNIAESMLINLANSIAKAILALRKSDRNIHRIDYRPSVA